MHKARELEPRVAWGRGTQSTVWITGGASGVGAAEDNAGSALEAGSAGV